MRFPPSGKTGLHLTFVPFRLPDRIDFRSPSEHFFDAFPRKSAATCHIWTGVHARASDWTRADQDRRIRRIEQAFRQGVREIVVLTSSGAPRIASEVSAPCFDL